MPLDRCHQYSVNAGGQIGGAQPPLLAVVERGGTSRNDTPAVSQLSGRMLNRGIMPGKNIAVPDEIYECVQKIATAEGTTVEELATKALERDLARRWLERVGREGQLRRGNMTDDEVEAVVERAVQESRGRS